MRGVPSPYGFAEYALSFPGRRGGGSLLIESAAVHLKKSTGSQAAVIEVFEMNTYNLMCHDPETDRKAKVSF